MRNGKEHIARDCRFNRKDDKNPDLAMMTNLKAKTSSAGYKEFREEIQKPRGTRHMSVFPEQFLSVVESGCTVVVGSK